MGPEMVRRCRMRKFYFLSSSHLEDKLLFQDDEDYKAGMNYVAIAALRAGVEVLVFVLMSNHVHFILWARDADARIFSEIFKRLYSGYYRKKYGIDHLLRRNNVDYREVPVRDEKLMRAIAYVIMNPVAANICLSPTTYRWGCGASFFSSRPLKGKSLSSMSVREKMRFLHSKQAPDVGWILCDEGYILPESFIRKDFVESLFGTAKRLNFFLINSAKAKKATDTWEHIQPSFQDQTLIYVMRDIYSSVFRKSRWEELSISEKERLVYEMRRRLGPDPVQLSRVLGVRPDELSEIISRL